MNCVGQRRLAKYDDTFEPRAFGDNMQKWGRDRADRIRAYHERPGKTFGEKTQCRWHSCGPVCPRDGSVCTCKRLSLRGSPFQRQETYDLIVRDILVVHRKNRTTLADIGISYQVDTHPESIPVLVDLGDLRSFIGLREVDGKRARLPQSKLILGKPFSFRRW